MSNKSINWTRILFFGFFLILCLGIAGGALYSSMSQVTPRDDLKEVRGQVSARAMKRHGESGYYVKAQLAGYDRALVYYDPEQKIDAVYSGLQVGTDVVLLVKEGETTATIWEGRSNGNVFLLYETVAQWRKSNGWWALGLGLAFLGASGFFAWLIVRGIKTTSHR